MKTTLFPHFTFAKGVFILFGICISMIQLNAQELSQKANTELDESNNTKLCYNKGFDLNVPSEIGKINLKSFIKHPATGTQREVLDYGWITLDIGISDSLKCVDFINANEGWIAADTLGILHTLDGGFTWNLINLVGVDADYNHVYYFNDQTGWISGKRTYFRTQDGSDNWEGGIDTSMTVIRNASFPVNSNILWLVGGNVTNCERRKFFKQNFTGVSSTVTSFLPDPCFTTLRDVYMTSINIGWAVGSPGEIWKTTNGSSSIPAPSWSMQVSNTTISLNAIFMLNDQMGWIVGDTGYILQTINGGTNWIPQTSGTTNNLLGVSFISSLKGIAVGEVGTIIKTEDGGQTWMAETSGTTETLTSVYFVNNTNAYAVGYNGTILKYTELPPSIPTLMDPPNASVNRPLTLTLSWNESSGAETYNIEVSDVPTFSNLILSENGIISTSKVVSGLQLSTIYYWRVSATNGVGTSGWSEAWSFGTIPPAPDIPSLLNPANGAVDQPVNLSFSWNGANGADSYVFEVSTLADFSNLVYSASNITDTSHDVNGLPNSTTFFWRVNASNPGGMSGWSETWSFTTLLPVPGIPLLVSPPNGSFDQALNLTLSWNVVNGADSYGYEVATTPDFTTVVFAGNNVTSATQDITGLANSTTYYWRVNGTNIGGTGDWSEVWSFTTLPPVPGVPILLNPPNGSFDQPLDPVLSWNEVGAASGYDLEVSTSSDFSNTIFSESNITSLSKSISGLINSTTYYWRVNASNTGGTSNWSETWSFTTMNMVGTSDVSFDKLIKLYPNPTSNILHIEGLVNEDATITIILLDGKVLMQEAGRGLDQINLSDFQKGIYLIKISTSRGMVIRKIVKQ